MPIPAAARSANWRTGKRFEGPFTRIFSLAIVVCLGIAGCGSSSTSTTSTSTSTSTSTTSTPPATVNALGVSADQLVGRKVDYGPAASLAVFDKSVAMIDGLDSSDGAPTLSVAMARDGGEVQTWKLPSTPLVGIRAVQVADELVVIGGDCQVVGEAKVTEDPNCGMDTVRIVALSPKSGKWRTVAKDLPGEWGFGPVSADGKSVYIDRQSRVVSLVDGTEKSSVKSPEDLQVCASSEGLIGARSDVQDVPGQPVKRSLDVFVPGPIAWTPQKNDALDALHKALVDSDTASIFGCVGDGIGVESYKGGSTTVTVIGRASDGTVQLTQWPPLETGEAASKTGEAAGFPGVNSSGKSVIISTTPKFMDHDFRNDLFASDGDKWIVARKQEQPLTQSWFFVDGALYGATERYETTESANGPVTMNIGASITKIDFHESG